jgi:hypothetical protein
MAAEHGPPVFYWQNHAHQDQDSDLWQHYLDPNQLSFWQEGDYTPPAPLIVAMKNPSEKNIENYMRYLSLRASYQERFQSSLAKYRQKSVKKVVIAVRSDCGACHSLLEDLKAIDVEPEKIQLVQIDRGSFAHLKIPWSITKIDEEQTKTLGVKMVPTVWIQNGQGIIQLPYPQKILEVL